jgi:acetoacetate decarboxylase
MSIHVRAVAKQPGAKSPKHEAQDLEAELNWLTKSEHLVQIIPSVQSDDHILAICQDRP